MIKPLKAYAIVEKKNPKLFILDIYKKKDVKLHKDEKWIEVIITPKNK